MASMANIPTSFYEAADLDGAGKVKQFFAVTLPLVWNNIQTTLTQMNYKGHNKNE